STIRTARSRTSGEYFTGLLMTPSSQELEPPGIPGRFTRYRHPQPPVALQASWRSGVASNETYAGLGSQRLTNTPKPEQASPETSKAQPSGCAFSRYF